MQSLKGYDTASIALPISETHKNYILMYDMLTGIRVSISRIEAKVPKQLENEDFASTSSFNFDFGGSECTPSSKHNFKFKDYAPWVFRYMRKAFGIDPAEYLVSLTGKYVLSELGSPGKSGAFFYYSADYKYIIKTIHHREHLLLRKVLKEYYGYMQQENDTLLTKFLGLYRVEMSALRKIHFVVMVNILPVHKSIHETYDIKGSTSGRFIRPAEIVRNPASVLKDNNWIKNNRSVYLSERTVRLLVDQLAKDSLFLCSLDIMDYSLLIAIHFCDKDGEIQEFTVIEEVENTAGRKRSLLKRTVREPTRVNKENTADACKEKTHSIFNSEDGGIESEIYNDGHKEMYFVGIIDILTLYGKAKRFENFIKTMRKKRSKNISAISPERYQARFMEFLESRVLKKGAE